MDKKISFKDLDTTLKVAIIGMFLFTILVVLGVIIDIVKLF